MIRTAADYNEALQRLEKDREVAEAQRAALRAARLAPEEVECGMQPLLTFQAQLAAEVEWYERVCRRDFPTLSRLTDLGRLLIALRISRGRTQRDLAQALGVSEAAVSRDERNAYQGITLERAQRVLDALEESVLIDVTQPAYRVVTPGLVAIVPRR